MDCYSAYAKHDFESAQCMTKQINDIIDKMKHKWRYPQIGNQLEHLIQSKLQYLDKQNKKYEISYPKI
jgi:hypothetical protein